MKKLLLIISILMLIQTANAQVVPNAGILVIHLHLLSGEPADCDAYKTCLHSELIQRNMEASKADMVFFLYNLGRNDTQKITQNIKSALNAASTKSEEKLHLQINWILAINGNLYSDTVVHDTIGQ